MVAKHDGTECFPVFISDKHVTYYPVPGGVVMHLMDKGSTAVFIPMVELFKEEAAGFATGVRLESTITGDGG